jgi:hypothetical protein
MFAYCIQCDYKTPLVSTVGELIGTVKLAGGLMESIYSKCPKCAEVNSLMVDLVDCSSVGLTDIIKVGEEK